MNTSALEVSHLDIAFTDATNRTIQIASQLNFSIEPGRSLCLVGRSGSGKTSILRAAAGLAKPNAGSIAWWGRPLDEMPLSEQRIHRRTRIGYADQDSTLIPDLSALENVLIAVLPDGHKVVKSETKYARQLLSELGLESRLHHRPESLSGGERQRVALARALLRRPELVIVDEPTASLDTAWADHVIAILKAYQRAGGALLAASHDPAVVAAADAVIHVEPGRDDL